MEVSPSLHTTCGMLSHLWHVQAVDTGWWVVEVVQVHGVVVGIGVHAVAVGAGHGFRCSLNRQLTEAPFQTMLISLLAVTAQLWSAQPWNTKEV